MYKHQQVVAVIPARDEALSVGSVIVDIKALTNENGRAVFDRILVCDNASVDGTASIARTHGAEVIYQSRPGYGIACLSALSLIEETEIIVFIDADASLQIDESIALLDAIEGGADLVIGARDPALQQVGSMTLPQRFGNVLASLLIRVIWQVPVSDLGPFRAIRYTAIQRLQMQDTSFGWTVEMQVKAIQHCLNMVEVPVHYRRRIGQSKISGTVSGVIRAGIGIFSTIFKLALRPTKLPLQPGRRHP
jgi:glycosyltransferase involved in cell wall biosynthesis